MFGYFCYDCGHHGTAETEAAARARLLDHYDHCTGPQVMMKRRPRLAEYLAQPPKAGA